MVSARSCVATAHTVAAKFAGGSAVINRDNYHHVKAYCTHLQTVVHVSPSTAGRYFAYLRHLLLWADDTPLTEAPNRQPAFPTYLAHIISPASAEPLAPTTLKKILQTTQRFFTWARLAFPVAYKGVSPLWLQSLRLPRQPERIKEHVFVSLPELLALTQLAIPDDDLALRRDQAAAALLFLSGMRVGALSTLPIEAVNLAEGTLRQWPSLGVHTKNGKAATTFLLPIPELHASVRGWDEIVRAQLPPTAMWFTPISLFWGEQSLSAAQPGRNRIVAVNKRLRRLFRLAHLPPRSPHKFRHGHAVWALQHARTMADYKAISQNLMHSDIRVTDGIYAGLLSDEVQTRVAGLDSSVAGQTPLEGDLTNFLNRLPTADIPAALHLLAERLAR